MPLFLTQVIVFVATISTSLLGMNNTVSQKTQQETHKKTVVQKEVKKENTPTPTISRIPVTKTSLLTATPKPTTFPTPTVTPVQKVYPTDPYTVRITKPLSGESFKKGQTIQVEASITGSQKDSVTKVEYGMGKSNQMISVGTSTTPPYTISFRVPESYYITDDNQLPIGVWAYGKDGKYVTDFVSIKVKDANLSVRLKTPTRDQEFKTSDTVQFEAEVSGEEATKVEFFMGAGHLIATSTTKPFTTSFNLSPSYTGIPYKYIVPIAVKAYDKDGNYVSENFSINVSP